jgi:hypothetical protein
VVYFTNRVEIGNLQQKERLNLMHEFLWESDVPEKKQKLSEAKKMGISSKLDENKVFDVTCELREIDQLGKIGDLSQPKVAQKVDKASYIKLINVPSLLDINGTVADPSDESLEFSMIDFATLNVFSKYLSKSKNPIE